jgi:hypothetical protein
VKNDEGKGGWKYDISESQQRVENNIPPLTQNVDELCNRNIVDVVVGAWKMSLLQDHVKGDCCCS